MAKRTVYVALFRYRDSDGARKVAYFGDQIDVTGDDLERGTVAGVFNTPATAKVDPVLAPAVKRALSGGVEPPTPEPGLPGEEDLPVPPHDVRAEASPIPVADDEPAPLAPVEQPEIGDAPEPAAEKPGRPKNAAKVEVWREYIAAVRPDLADKVGQMTKEQLQAVEV